MHFPPKFLKIVATRGEIFSLKFTKYRLAAGLRPDPLGELKRSPDPLAAIGGPTSKGRGREGRIREGRGKGGEGEGRGRGRGGWNLLQGVRGIDAPARRLRRLDCRAEGATHFAHPT